MARSRARRATGNGGEPVPPASERDRIIDALLSLVATEGWRRLSLAQIASEAGVPILAVYRNYGSKPAILGAFMRRVDEAALAHPPAPEEGEKPRDRLFDLLMRRFEALRPHKPALEVLSRELRGDPIAALCLGTALLRSMAWMLTAADIATDGVRGLVAVKLTTAAYLSAARIWQRDDGEDMGRTMAHLDQRLSRIERWLTPLTHPRRDETPATA